MTKESAFEQMVVLHGNQAGKNFGRGIFPQAENAAPSAQVRSQARGEHGEGLVPSGWPIAFRGIPPYPPVWLAGMKGIPEGNAQQLHRPSRLVQRTGLRIDGRQVSGRRCRDQVPAPEGRNPVYP
jgi:hypothetical protein